MQQIILEAQVDERAAEDADRMPAESEAGRQAMTRKVEQERTVIAEDAQRRIQQAEASAAGVTDGAQRRSAQEENEKREIPHMAEQM
eukprot:968766-Pyramimonas_sp.AAC.1